MATSRRTRAATPAVHAAASPSRPPRTAGAAADPWSGAMRHQLECGMLAFVAMLESAESMHRFLLDSTHSARKRHEAMRARVHAAGSMDQLALAESELWRFDTDLMSRYWQEVAETVTHMNAELQTQVSEAVEHWFDDMPAPATLLATGTGPAARWFAPFAAAR